ncbi:MAG TPA: hypothetical protein VK155_02360 [Bacteroidales bacterium]|jgi:hypothetical protein|nr:hypothetical protein [Bacteroidales bacterium]
METKDIIILVACIAAAGFSLYRKYASRNKQDTGSGPGFTGTSINAGGDDDYEPYSGK